MTVPNFSKRGTTESDAVCLLNYLPSTYPIPIQTGTGQTPARAVLNTAALPRAGQNVYCNKIIIAVPVGIEAGDIFRQTPDVSVNTGKWAMTASEKKTGRELGLEDDDTVYATFTFDCRDQSDYLINYSLVFGISGAVSPVPSQCVVRVMENSGATNDPSTYTRKTGSYTVTTSTPIFYLQNFVATASGSPTVPATEFANGADVNLAWESNGTFFQIYQKDNPRPVWAGTQTSCTLRGGVKTDTTFFLVAMVSGDPGGDRPQPGYQPIYLYDALSVTVTNPDLTPNTSNISGNAGVGGTLNVTGNTTLANATVGGTLGVGGTLNATGATTLANASVTGKLGVGISGPQQMLSVGGSMNVDQNNLNNGALVNPGITFGSASGEGIASKRTSGGNHNGLDLYTNWVPRLSITSNGKVGIGLGAKMPQNALDVNGGVVIGSTFAGAQNAPDSGLKVEGKVILNNDLAVENGTATVNRLQFSGAQGWTAQTQSAGLQLTNSSGLVAQFAPDKSCWFQGPVGSAFGFNSAGPIILYDAGENAWRRLCFAKEWGYQWATLVPHPIPSDLRLKSDVQLVPSALEKIRRLSGVTFRWNDDALQHFTRDIETTIFAGPNATEQENQKVWQTERGKRRNKLDTTQVGIVAQDVEAVLPEAVTTDEAGYKSVRYDNLIPLLIEAIKEQDLTMTTQAALAARQQTEIEQLRQTLLTPDSQLVALLKDAIKEQGAQIQVLSSEVSALAERLRDKPM